MVLPGLVRCSGGRAQRGALGGVHGDFGGGRSRARERHLRQSKVQNFGVAALGDKNIRGLDVAVNDVFGVRGIQRVGDLDGQRQQIFAVHRAPVDAVLQRLPIQEFHGDERLAVLLANIVNRADVGMVQGGGGLRFTLESRQGLRIPGDILRQKFQRHEALQPRVFGLVNDTHASAAELFDDAVVGERLAN